MFTKPTVMNIRTYFEKHQDGTLKDAEWEQLAEALIQAKFDKAKRDEWSQQLHEMGVERNVPAMQFQASTIRKWLAAATILLVAGTLSWYFLGQSALTPAQQMAGNYLEQPFRLNQGNTRGEASIEKNRGKAIEAFDMRQYEKSLQYLQIIEAEGQAKAADYFQMGLCLMYQKKPDYTAALRTFEAARKQDATVYADEINWFAGLCHLMSNQLEAARVELKKVAESASSRNRDAAVRILEQVGEK